jgi:competence protein ComEA
MGCDPPVSPSTDSHHLLRRDDQAVLGVLVLLGLVATIGWWVANGGLHGRLVEVDQAEPKSGAFLVDLNRAQWPELAQLPGIGPVLARRIVDSRKTDGPFSTPDDLIRIRGIGPKRLARIRPYLK